MQVLLDAVEQTKGVSTSTEQRFVCLIQFQQKYKKIKFHLLNSYNVEEDDRANFIAERHAVEYSEVACNAGCSIIFRSACRQITVTKPRKKRFPDNSCQNATLSAGRNEP